MTGFDTISCYDGDRAIVRHKGVQSISTNTMTFKHFQLREVAERVYAAISIPGIGLLGNAGFFDLCDHVFGNQVFHGTERGFK